ncbi:hypothetical protein EJ02DRAFT_474399 [Clathrospora elynae]|uniref:Uncharacterized protein n=1 Tax=Clathrospora elynae TaxID=706981 RepID=A0A6A5SF25_9PLEO|nr:hypothetical protein EJ02DRAFT_474399 [Clathrospora elynae]
MLRKKEKAEKASRAATCRTHQQLKQALKISQKGNKRSLKSPTGGKSKKSAVVRPTASIEPQGAPALRSQCSRNIKPSKQY